MYLTLSICILMTYDWWKKNLKLSEIENFIRSSKISDVLVKFSTSFSFNFFFSSIIWHQDSYWKCQINLQEYARKKSKIIRMIEQNIFYQTQATATFTVKTKSIDFAWKLMLCRAWKNSNFLRKNRFSKFFRKIWKNPRDKSFEYVWTFPQKNLVFIRPKLKSPI